MTTALVTAGALARLERQISKIWLSISASIEPRTYAFGQTAPATENRGKVWLRTDSNGNFDGNFVWNPALSNWFTVMPTPLGSIAIFAASQALEIGWEPVSSSVTGVIPATGYGWRKFSGTGLQVISNIAYRRWDQPRYSS